MKINSIMPLNIPSLNKNSMFKSKQIALQSDTFIKTQSFKGNKTQNSDKSFEALQTWSSNTDFLSKVQEIDEKTGKILGGGFEGTTYEIPQTDNWVLKKYNRGNFVPIQNEKAKLSEIKDISPLLNIGQTIARVEIPAGKNYSYVYYVLKRQTGKSIGVPLSSADYINESNINTHLMSLEQLANAPQTTFDKCVKDIQYVTEQGYEFDAGNPYNFMFDSEKQHINFVDINDRLRDKSTQYGDVLYALLDGKFRETFDNSDCDENIKHSAEMYSNHIIEKFFTAMKKNNAKFSDGRYFAQLINSNAFDGVLKTSSLEERVNELKDRGLI